MLHIQIPDPPYQGCKIITSDSGETWSCKVHDSGHGLSDSPEEAIDAIVQHVTEATFHAVAYALILDLHETVTECKDD